MTSSIIHTYKQAHHFDTGNPVAEKKTLIALVFTVVMMVVEIFGGWYFNSMALLADGWHMSSHALALGLTLVAYVTARRLAHHKRFAFGTWKIEILASYTSAIFLVLIAISMFYHSAERLISPVSIHYDEAIVIAIVGLIVNLICAWLLKEDHHHAHDDEQHHDLNLRSAYIHVLTDAATSILAIVALTAGKFWGAAWLDPVMGLVGGVLIGIWSIGLLRDSGRVLLDAEMDAPLVDEVTKTIEESPFSADVVDLHIWRVGKQNYACILALTTKENFDPEAIKSLLSAHPALGHVTVEINPEKA